MFYHIVLYYNLLQGLQLYYKKEVFFVVTNIHHEMQKTIKFTLFFLDSFLPDAMVFDHIICLIILHHFLHVSLTQVKALEVLTSVVCSFIKEQPLLSDPIPKTLILALVNLSITEPFFSFLFVKTAA